MLLAALVLGACGGDDDAGPDTSATPPDPRAALEVPAAGQGVAVLDVQQLDFEVTACVEGPAPDDPVEATRELRVEGEGTGGDGPFTVEILRYRSEADAAVVSETARVTFGEGDEARGAEAMRSTAGPGGAWLDLTDPDADGPLISRTGDSIDVRATFGPRGAVAGDEGLVEGRIRATCPA